MCAAVNGEAGWQPLECACAVTSACRGPCFQGVAQWWLAARPLAGRALPLLLQVASCMMPFREATVGQACCSCTVHCESVQPQLQPET